MEEVLKKLVESKLLTSDTMETISEAFARKEAEIEEKTEQRVRAEFARKFDENYETLVDAVEKLVEDRLDVELADFQKDASKLKKLQAKAAAAIAEADKRAERKLSQKIDIIEGFVSSALDRELGEFAEDQKLQRRKWVEAMNEAKAKSAKERNAFIERGAVVIESVIDRSLSEKLHEFKEDIKEARKSAFGRKIVEAFEEEFLMSFFNQDKEVKKVVAERDEAVRRLSETRKQLVAENRSLKLEADRLKAKQQLAEEKTRREQVMEQVLRRLSGTKKAQMKELLEGVETKNLRKAYRKYLPTITESAPKKAGGKRALKEGSKGRTPLVFKEGARTPRIRDEEEKVDQDLIDLDQRLRKLR